MMKTLSFAAAFCIAVVGYLLLAPSATGQSKQTVRATLDNYTALLDAIFPRSNLGGVYAFAIRVAPAFDAELQLSVTVDDNDNVAAELVEVMGRSAGDVLAEDGRAVSSIEELAKLVRVRRRSVAVNLRTVDEWRTELLGGIRSAIGSLEERYRTRRESGDRSVAVKLDGARYDVRYIERQVATTWAFDDVDPVDRSAGESFTRILISQIEEARRLVAR